MSRYYYTIVRNIFRLQEAIKIMKNMNIQQISELVKGRMADKISKKD